MAADITYHGATYATKPGETVLECLERNGLQLPHFCRQGSCQSCLVKLVQGAAPARAQAGLRDAQKREGLLLSCVCEAEEPLTLEPLDTATAHVSHIHKVQYLSPNVVRLWVAKPDGFTFEGGQFVRLGRTSDLVERPYSIASLPRDPFLEFHVAVHPHGALSPWLAQGSGQAVSISEPRGECVYVPGELDRPLLLAATGTGLAPLLAIVRAAVDAGHRAPIALFHGARTESELYYWRELQALGLPPNVTITGVCLEDPTSTSAQLTRGDLLQVVLAAQTKPLETRFFLCGNPQLVQSLKKRLYLAGASLAWIHSDPFLPPGSPGPSQTPG